MRSLLLIASLLGGAFLTSAFAQTGPAGHWEGTIQLPDRDIQIVLEMGKNDQGTWAGTFSQGPQNVPLSDLKIADKSVKFHLAAGAGAPEFDCTLESAAAMKCAVTTPAGSVTAAMKRTGDLKGELPKSSPAVSAELEGNWEGAISLPNGSMSLVVHFRNQPDKTVKATLDVPQQNSKDLQLSDVVQKGKSVEFQLKLVGGAYKGTLNEASSELTGEWTQSGNSMPLTLKKSK